MSDAKKQGDDGLNMYIVWDIGTYMAFVTGSFASVVAFILLAASNSQVFRVAEDNTLRLTWGFFGFLLAFVFAVSDWGFFSFLLAFVFAVFAFLWRIHFQSKKSLEMLQDIIKEQEFAHMQAEVLE